MSLSTLRNLYEDNSSDDESQSKIVVEKIQVQADPMQNFHQEITTSLERSPNQCFALLGTPPNSKSIIPLQSFRQVTNYAMPRSLLPNDLVTFLAHLRLYFVKEVNLERSTGPISPTTFDKAEERLLCKLNMKDLDMYSDFLRI